MTKTRRDFTPEFKREAVALLQSGGRPLTRVAAELGIQPSMLRVNEVIFDHQGKVIFAGGNEFRNLDLRSIQAPAAGSIH